MVDFDLPKDDYGNYKMQQYNENNGFDVKKSLEEYKIAELSDPKKMDRLIEGLKDGERM